MNLHRSQVENLLRQSQSVHQQTAIWLSAVREPQHRTNRVLLPGAFNPLHAGHAAMATVAKELLGREIDYEISVVNVDKSPLNFADVERRVAQFTAQGNLWLTKAATFVAKAELFPQSTFVVGIDTLARIAAPRYYAGDLPSRDAAIQRLTAHCSQFLVFGRVYQGQFQTLADLQLPAALRALCHEVPATTFRKDISSTRLRGDTSTDHT